MRNILMAGAALLVGLTGNASAWMQYCGSVAIDANVTINCNTGYVSPPPPPPSYGPVYHCGGVTIGPVTGSANVTCNGVPAEWSWR